MTREKIERLIEKIRNVLDEECSKGEDDYEYGDGLIFACCLRAKGTKKVLTDMATVGYPLGIANALTHSDRNVMKLVLKLLKNPDLHEMELTKLEATIEKEIKQN